MIPFHNVLLDNMRAMVDNKLIVTFLVLVLLDIATGFGKSFLATETSSKTQSTKGLNGLIKHGMVILIIFVLYPLLAALGYRAYGDITVIFYILNYAISILENFGQAGIKYPHWLENKLGKLQDDYDHGKGDK